MSQGIEPKRGRGRPPLVIDMDMFATFAELQATYKQIAGAFRCTERTIQKRMLEPEFIEAYEQGKERGKLNLKQLQWNHARGLDYKGEPVKNPGSGPVNMTIHLSKQWLGESDKSDVQVNPIELVITRIERVIVECSPDSNRQSIPTLITAQAVQGR